MEREVTGELSLFLTGFVERVFFDVAIAPLPNDGLIQLTKNSWRRIYRSLPTVTTLRPHAFVLR